eukprot:5408039-Lingulodinium_polyedra.AAC.1
MKVCPERAHATRQRNFFCTLYVDDNAFARINSAALGATVDAARGRAPRQQTEQTTIYRCC